MMRLRDLSVVIFILTILITGTTGLIRSGPYREKRELENTVDGEDKISATTKSVDSFSMIDSSMGFQTSKESDLDTHESLPIIPYSDSASLSRNSLYTFNFNAEEGDKIHIKVSVNGKVPVQIVLMSVDELSEYPDNKTFGNLEKISEASKDETRHLEAHVTIPEDDEYSLVISYLSRDGVWDIKTEFDMIIGRGLFSSIVVRIGGYIELFFASSFFVIVLGTGFYLYKRRKKKTPTEEEWREENTKKSEKSENSRPKAPPAEETESSPDNKEYLQYGD